MAIWEFYAREVTREMLDINSYRSLHPKNMRSAIRWKSSHSESTIAPAAFPTMPPARPKPVATQPTPLAALLPAPCAGGGALGALSLG